MKRIAFLIIGTNQNPWRRIYLRGQLPTWISQLDENETHLVVYSDSSMGPSHPNKHNGLKIDLKIDTTRTKNKPWRSGPHHLKIVHICLKIGVPWMRLIQFV